MVWIKRLTGNITVLTGALMLALGWIVASTGIPPAYRAITEVLPELVAIITIILAWRFRRSRLVLAALTLALSNQLLRGPLTGEIAAGDGAGLAALAILLPLNLGILVILPDRPVPRPSTLVHLTVILAQPWLVHWLLDFTAGDLQLSAWFVLAQTTQASLMIFLIAAIFALLGLAVKRSALEVSMLWVLACCLLALHGDFGFSGAAMMLGAAQLTLLLGLFEDSHRLAFLDDLTGLPGRRALNDALRLLNGRFAVGMVDIDHFKNFNDRHGHEAGDQALRMVGDCLNHVGGGGTAYRYGGEEFTILFTGSSAETAKMSLEELRTAIAARKFSIRAKKRPRKKPKRLKTPKKPPKQLTLTVSMGLAKPNARHASPDAVLRAADKNLYRAKKNGRNRVVG